MLKEKKLQNFKKKELRKIVEKGINLEISQNDFIELIIKFYKQKGE